MLNRISSTWCIFWQIAWKNMASVFQMKPMHTKFMCANKPTSPLFHNRIFPHPFFYFSNHNWHLIKVCRKWSTINNAFICDWHVMALTLNRSNQRNVQLCVHPLPLARHEKNPKKFPPNTPLWQQLGWMSLSPFVETNCCEKSLTELHQVDIFGLNSGKR